jgi:PAS domain S-box-containing protein/putative nucleotidyltransferase with HDIG domain
MTERIQILLVEDDESTASLIEQTIRKSGYEVAISTAKTFDEMKLSLSAHHFDAILVDHDVRSFDTAEGLRLIKKDGDGLPFIVIASGGFGDDAEALMKAGVDDFILKEKLQRLGPALRRELKEAHNHQLHKSSEANHIENETRLRQFAATVAAEHEKVKEKLKEDEDRFQLLIENASDIILFVDPDHRVTYGSPSVEKLLGYKPEEYLGKDEHGFIHPEDVQKVILSTEEAVRTRRVPKMEMRIRHKEGGWRTFESNTTLQFDGDNLLGFIVNLRDVSDRKEAEYNLKKSEELFKTLAHVSPVGIYMCNFNGEVLFVNDQWCTITGITNEEAAGLGWTKILHPEDKEKVLNEFLYAAQNQRRYKTECRFQRPDGTIRWILGEGIATTDSLGKPIYYIGTVTDVTDFHSQRENLLRLNRALSAVGKCNEAILRAISKQQLMDVVCNHLVTHGGYAAGWITSARQANIPETISKAGDYEDLIACLADEQCELESTRREANTVRVPVEIATRSTQCKLSLLEFPLYDHTGNIFAILNICERDTQVFSKEEFKLLEGLAADLSFGISTLQLREERDLAQRESTRFQKKLRQSLEDGLQALAATLELRDPYTAGHQQRVGELAAEIARELGLTEEEVHAIRLAGVVHDIGKIHIPAELLAKPTPLTRIEYELVKTHSQAGYEILKSVEFPWPIAEIVWQHHERLDGSGYPRGLKGDEILQETRIISVADVVEAMASHRPYRPGLGINVALNAILEERGTLFDPEVVDACIKVFTEKNFHFTAGTPLEPKPARRDDN